VARQRRRREAATEKKERRGGPQRKEGRGEREKEINPKLACFLIKCLPRIYTGFTIANELSP
jgi:hypothetical protein